MDGAAGELYFGVAAFVDFQDDFAVADVHDGAADSADGLDAIAAFEVIDELFSVALLAAFRVHGENHEDQHDRHQWQHRAAKQIAHASPTPARGARLR